MPFDLDNLLLKSFISIAESGTFSNAAHIVGRTQSAISLQIKKLEDNLECQLFDRSFRKVSLTPHGEIFLQYAKQIIQLQWEAYSKIREPDAQGEISLGVPEDFASHYLPGVLSTFHQHHPNIQLKVSCDLTLHLIDGFQKGSFDIILIKRDPKTTKQGIKVWREDLVWAASRNYQHSKKSLPLVLAPEPCIYRSRALSVLEKNKKNWHITYSSPSLSGRIAAVKEGLGITILPANMLPEGIQSLPKHFKMPTLKEAEIALMIKKEPSKTSQMLADYIIDQLEHISAS